MDQDQPSHKSRHRYDQREQEPEEESGNCQLVRQKLVFSVDEDECEQKKGKDRKLQSRPGQSELQEYRKEDQTCKQFHQKITRRDAGLALATAATQPQPAEYGNVVVSGYRCRAARASRARRDHRKPTRQPVNHNVEKASESQSINKHREREERSEFRILDMQACCPEIALGLYETVG